MHILIAEDDGDIAELIALYARKAGWTPHITTSGDAALAHARSKPVDVAILDIMLPEMDGEQVLYQLRRGGNKVPVIMLTARDALRDKVRNLDTGADDYLTKPFHVEELLSRLRALLRRIEGDEVLRAADLTVNTDTREVRRGGRRIELTTREYELLEFMARNARRVLPRDLILARVWEHTPDVDTNVVDVYIRYLRNKIDKGFDPPLIMTRWGEGYQMRGEES